MQLSFRFSLSSSDAVCSLSKAPGKDPRYQILTKEKHKGKETKKARQQAREQRRSMDFLVEKIRVIRAKKQLIQEELAVLRREELQLLQASGASSNAVTAALISQQEQRVDSAPLAATAATSLRETEQLASLLSSKRPTAGDQAGQSKKAL